jgi:hypothetical protein
MRKRILRFSVALAGVLVIGFLVYQFAPLQSPPLPDSYRGRRAAWMDITWAMDTHTDADIQQLAADLTLHGVQDAYFYVSYLKFGDKFNPTFDHAADFTRRMHALAPDIRLFAWLGVPISIMRDDGTIITNRLTDAAIRQQIADFSAYTITELGYDGVHLNAELVPNDDPYFLQTLAQIRAALPDNAVFSTTAHALRLTHAITFTPYPEQGHHWTSAYLQNVAQHVDQIALMAYDSGLPFPRDSRVWVAYQTEVAARSLNDTDTELLIGVPTSEEWTGSHQTQAETLAHALNGFRMGQAAFPASNVGLAIYPYWEMDDGEWLLIES